MSGINARMALIAGAMMGSLGQAIEISPRPYIGSSPAGFGNYPLPYRRNPMKGRPGDKLAKKAAKGTIGISHPR